MLAAARSFLPQVSKQLVSLSFRRSGFTVAAGAPRAPKTSPSGFLTGSIAGADPVSCGGFRGAACVVKNPAAALSAPRATRGITMAFDEEGPLVALYNKCASVLPEHPRNGTTEERDLAKAIAPFLDAIQPHHLVLSPPQMQNNRTGLLSKLCTSGESQYQLPISYLKLHEDAVFNMGTFVFPPATAMPLHNHPRMTVLSKLLYGKVHWLSYDWVDANEFGKDGIHGTLPGTPRLAWVVCDRVVEATEGHMALYSTSGGNVHSIRSITPAAMLDILTPPYSPEHGRECHYFKEVPKGPNGEPPGPGQAWLVEIDCPDFEVIRGTYNGPKFGSEVSR